MSRKMMPEELKEHIISFLQEHREGALATCMENIPRSSPVQYFLGRDMGIYILSAGGDKFEAIKRNPNVCLLVNTHYLDSRKIKGVQIFGKAVTSMQDKNLIQEAKMYAPSTYPVQAAGDDSCPAGQISAGASHTASGAGHEVFAIKIIPEEIVYLDSLQKGDRTKQILKNNQVVVKEDRAPALARG